MFALSYSHFRLQRRGTPIAGNFFDVREFSPAQGITWVALGFAQAIVSAAESQNT
jgi:hypothetical protein